MAGPTALVPTPPITGSRYESRSNSPDRAPRDVGRSCKKDSVETLDHPGLNMDKLHLDELITQIHDPTPTIDLGIDLG